MFDGSERRRVSSQGTFPDSEKPERDHLPTIDKTRMPRNLIRTVQMLLAAMVLFALI